MAMAPNALPSREGEDLPSTTHQPNLRNPLPLSAGQEAQVKDIYYRRVRGRCAQEIKGKIPYVVYDQVKISSTTIDL
jgi:COX assembly mitochondrial protein 1